jgi:ATP-dependent helicase HrpA
MTLQKWKKEIARAMQGDRFRLRNQLLQIESLQTGGKDFSRLLERLKNEITASCRLAEDRRKSWPTLKFDETLPVNERRREIAERIQSHQVVVICGETGSGKSTQLPKICLDIGRGLYGMIGHTQPRRIAARSVAARIAEELGTPLGQQVGYKVRFADETSPQTLVKLMTDGILLAESQNDRFFEQYDTILIDEAHERSLNIDFLLGMMKRLIRKRRDLKLIITSATIDAARFAEHFTFGTQTVPVIEVSGRMFPIEVRYRPVLPDDAEEIGEEEPDQERAILKAVEELAREGRGDMLLFLPTERDILETAKKLRTHNIPGDGLHKTEILPLYARLPVEQQQKIFKTSPHRRIVLTTNVAESSLTVPGIRYVIDTGTARLSRYSAKSRTQRLPIEPVSRASADQRAGRCGRVGPGICIRLYSESDYGRRDRYTTPEIQRTNLASVILQTKTLNFGPVEKFPFLDPPRSAAISDGYKTLFEIGAIDTQQNLTAIGRRLSKLPVDPRIARMILAADEENTLREMLIIAAALEVQDPRERPQEQQEKADAAHQPFLNPESDFLSYLKIWDFFHDLKEKLSQNQLRKACVQNFLSYNRMREWSDIHLQLLRLLRESGLTLKARRDDYDAIHRSILTGLLSGIAQRDQRYEYLAAGHAAFYIWPGSGVAKRKGKKKETLPPDSENRDPKPAWPPWIVAAERVETTRKYLRTVGRIDPAWIEKLAGHLLRRTYSGAFWSRETGYVHAYETVSLLGLTVVPKRRVNFGSIHPQEAREIFITQALVDGELDTTLDFFRHNQNRLEEAISLQAKFRRHDLLYGPAARYDFYQSRIPDTVYDKVSLEKWYKPLPPPEKRQLFMTLDDLVRESVDENAAAAFPDTITTPHGTDVRLEYQFTPGEETDGLTVIVPLEGLREMEPSQLGWLVPGLLQQKIEAMLRALPKNIRRTLVPVPETAKQIVQQLRFGQGTIEEAVAKHVSRLAGERVRLSDFASEKLPPELVMNVRVIGSDGKTLAASRELETLRSELGVQAAESVAKITDSVWNRDGITSWDFGPLPETAEIRRGSMKITAWPMLVDQKETVSLKLADSPELAQRKTRLGVVRLFQTANGKDLKTQVQWLPQIEKLKLYAQSIPQFDLKASLIDLIALRSLAMEDKPLPRSEADFQTLAQKGREQMGLAVQDVTRFITAFLEAYQQCRLLLEQNKSARFKPVTDDVRGQIQRLLPPDFMLQTPWHRLKEYPRYFKGIVQRFDKLRSGGEQQDKLATAELARWQDLYDERRKLHETLGIFDPQLEDFRWMLEEYRVSLFAQKLGTAVKVSDVRLQKQWDKTRM